ncbi:tetratricopeptide repeat protein [Chelativorans sp. M5D2P16]|uniref:tetratricopeptide repeat protein n=1 Tax=Chelativorans sp. M5D2P16 TaxID=3095678 RepID=UPI002ACA2456|nr:tetratricopeptide repeat protein [Chelativorans sp. M5D2P16]MDZ5698887.1 tetratricopeptide repeat protein [Chelativorans sp. M5D2P16]
MSDDSFIREVNEEFRQDQMKSLWRRYGALAVGIAALLILATASWVGYDYWSTSRANQAGDAFAQALELADEGQTEEALAALEELETSGYGDYPMLARLRAATLLAEAGRYEEAVAKFDAVAANGSAPAAIRDLANLRAGLILVDHGSYADVAARVEALTDDDNPMRHTAREALALAAWKEGDRENALALFEQIIDDPRAPSGTRQRAEMMSELIAGSASESG